MPAITQAEVDQLDLAKIDTGMDERRKDVDRITEGFDGKWHEIPSDRDGYDRLPQMNMELNMLGKRRATLMELKEGGEQWDAVKKLLDDPAKIVQPKGPATKSFSQQFLDHDITKKLLAGERGVGAEFKAADVGFKATLGEDAAQTNIDTDYPMRSDRLPGIVEELFRPVNIASLIPSINTTTTSIDYVTEDYTDAAAPVAEGDAKVEATEDFTLVTEVVRQIGVGIKASAQVLGDLGLMTGLLTSRIRADVGREEDNQLLLGDGTGQNLEGILNRTGIGNDDASLTGAAAQNFLESIYKAGTTIKQAFQVPRIVVMNALSQEVIRLSKDANLNYFFGPAFGAGEERVWGYLVVQNELMADPDTATNVAALVGDFANSALIARNPNVSVGVTDSDASDFLADILTFKVSIREALIVHRASGFATVTIVA